MIQTANPPRCQVVLLLSEIDRSAFRPDRITLVIDGSTLSLEEWRMDRDLDEWDRRYPDRLPSKRYNV